ncbi:MAG TPA: hypothetical protein HA224_01460 [Nanoarchaeota archaeon]|nr:hypothetical protein [Nanoarchaeota archaeon]
MSYKLGDTVVYNLLGTWYSGIVHGINGPQLLIQPTDSRISGLPISVDTKCVFVMPKELLNRATLEELLLAHEIYVRETTKYGPPLESFAGLPGAEPRPSA